MLLTVKETFVFHLFLFDCSNRSCRIFTMIHQAWKWWLLWVLGLKPWQAFGYLNTIPRVYIRIGTGVPPDPSPNKLRILVCSQPTNTLVRPVTLTLINLLVWIIISLAPFSWSYFVPPSSSYIRTKWWSVNFYITLMNSKIFVLTWKSWRITNCSCLGCIRRAANTLINVIFSGDLQLLLQR